MNEVVEGAICREESSNSEWSRLQLGKKSSSFTRKPSRRKCDLLRRRSSSKSKWSRRKSNLEEVVKFHQRMESSKVQIVEESSSTSKWGRRKYNLGRSQVPPVNGTSKMQVVEAEVKLH